MCRDNKASNDSFCFLVLFSDNFKKQKFTNSEFSYTLAFNYLHFSHDVNVPLEACAIFTVLLFLFQLSFKLN